MLLDASDAGLAHDLGVNYAPKLANIAVSDPAAVQTVTLGSPTPQQNPFGPAVVNFAAALAEVSADLLARAPDIQPVNLVAVK